MTLRGCAWIACAVLSVQANAPTAPQGRFRSSAEAVLVDVRVLDGGKPVAGLTAADFELRDGGVAQRIEAVTLEDVPVSVLLAFDVSRSVDGETLDQLKRAANAAIGALDNDDQAALLTFSEHVLLRTPWTHDRRALAAAIDTLIASGATALRDALFTAFALRSEAAGRTLLVVFSDGADTSSWTDVPTVLQVARETDIVVYGVTPRPLLEAHSGDETQIVNAQRAALKRWMASDPMLFPEMLLEEMTEQTGGELYHISSARDIPAAFVRILGDFKSRYLLTYEPTRVSFKGWHPIEVKLRGKQGTIRARRGYVR